LKPDKGCPQERVLSPLLWCLLVNDLLLFHTYHAVSLIVYIVSFPFDLHSAAVFDSRMPYRAPAVPLCYQQSWFETRSAICSAERQTKLHSENKKQIRTWSKRIPLCVRYIGTMCGCRLQGYQ